MAFDLKSVSPTRSERALFGLVFGTSGVGKTTFAADAPNAVFHPNGRRRRQSHAAGISNR